MTQGIKIMVDQQHHPPEALKTAYEIIRGYEGNRELHIDLILEDGMRVQLKSNKRVEVNDELRDRLSDLLGKSSVEMIIDRKSLSAKAEPKKAWGKR